MNGREAKREACAVVSVLIDQALTDGGPEGSNVFDPEWSQADRDRFEAAMRELAAELHRRGAG